MTVLINDTVGTLMSCAYSEPDTAIGLILGTGTNACYIESIDRIRTLYTSPERGATEVDFGFMDQLSNLFAECDF